MREGSYEKVYVERNKEILEWVEAVVTALIFFVFLFTVFFRFAVVNGNSMLPTLVNGDWVIIYNFLYEPSRGDIVVVNNLDNIDEPIIKRVIATEGDKITIDNKTGEVYVNGVIQDDEYCYSSNATYEGDYEFPEAVPKDCIFVMGDNRENSLDSRYEIIGTIKKEKVLGKAGAIIFPFRRMKLFY